MLEKCFFTYANQRSFESRTERKHIQIEGNTFKISLEFKKGH